MNPEQFDTRKSLTSWLIGSTTANILLVFLLGLSLSRHC